MGPAQWLAMARDDLRAAELLAEHGIAQLACFHSEQAVEKALMALRLCREPIASVVDDALPSTAPGDEAHGKGIALEAVQHAQQLVKRITDQVYGD